MVGGFNFFSCESITGLVVMVEVMIVRCKPLVGDVDGVVIVVMSYRCAVT